MNEVLCALCREPIANLGDAYREVHGWEHKRNAGGANQITLRRELAGRAHPGCVRQAVAGVPVTQGRLL